MLILGPLPHMSRTTDRRGGRDDSLAGSCRRRLAVHARVDLRSLDRRGVAVVGGEAGDGAEALSVVAETRPDVVTMDVEMPGMGGLEAVERLMDETPTPVLMLSAHTAEGAEVTFEALERGAVDFFSKPGGEVSTGVSRESDRLVEAVGRSVADADLDAATRDRREREAADSDQNATISRVSTTSTPPATTEIDGPLTVVIGASTGGPNAVERVMSALPMADCRVVIVQHMPEAFTARFADRLDEASAYDVRAREASDGARIGSGEGARRRPRRKPHPDRQLPVGPAPRQARRRRLAIGHARRRRDDALCGRSRRRPTCGRRVDRNGCRRLRRDPSDGRRRRADDRTERGHLRHLRDAEARGRDGRHRRDTRPRRRRAGAIGGEA